MVYSVAVGMTPSLKVRNCGDGHKTNLRMRISAIEASCKSQLIFVLNYAIKNKMCI